MKAHIGVDSRTKLIHSMTATAANVHDSQVLPDLLHGEETRVWGDSAYSGQNDVVREHARNRTKSKVRAKVEHVILGIKRIFGVSKVRCRGLAKNTHWLFVTCGLTNLYLARRRMLRVP